MTQNNYFYKDFEFVPITEECDYLRGFKIGAHCFQAECTTMACKCSETDWIDCFGPCFNGFKRSVSEGHMLSFIVKHCSTGDDAAFFFSIPMTYKGFNDTPSLTPLAMIFDELHENESSFLSNSDPQTQMWFGVAAVLPKYRGYGLQKHARYLTAKEAHRFGFKTMITDCTSDASRKSMLSEQKGGPSFERNSIVYSDWTHNMWPGEFPFASCVENGGYKTALIEQILHFD